MKLSHIIAAITFTSVLMGCQIEITPFDDDLAITSGNTTDNGTADTSITDNFRETIVATPNVSLYWSTPLKRVSGEPLLQSDIGGYEIRYKKVDDSQYTNIVLKDNSIERYTIGGLEYAGSYTFEVAVFDTDGIYSEFVVAN
ncbi:MAG: fibronectin type III domain-containing protein [Reinekea sp.]